MLDDNKVIADWYVEGDTYNIVVVGCTVGEAMNTFEQKFPDDEPGMVFNVTDDDPVSPDVSRVQPLRAS